MTDKNSTNMFDTVVSDFKQLYNFETKDGSVIGPKIKLPKVVYDRIEAFNSEDAIENGWTVYGILQLVLGNASVRDYRWYQASVGTDGKFRPSDEFDEWLERHYAFGRVLIMLAIIYNNYELEDKEND